jgi:hypothetical protein
VTRVPEVGNCVSLFRHHFDGGERIRWSRDDLEDGPIDGRLCAEWERRRR